MKTIARRLNPAPRTTVPHPASRKPQPFLLITLAQQLYALPLKELQEILPLAQLACPPGVPSPLAGFLNLGGTALPVVRLDRLFGVADVVPGLYTPLLVLRHPDSRLALLVERVERIVSVATHEILPVPAHQSFNDCAAGIWLFEQRIVLVLAVERILLEKEQQWLAELQDQEQRRWREWEEAKP